jgi:hypothetical protein
MPETVHWFDITEPGPDKLTPAQRRDLAQMLATHLRSRFCGAPMTVRTRVRLEDECHAFVRWLDAPDLRPSVRFGRDIVGVSIDGPVLTIRGRISL